MWFVKVNKDVCDIQKIQDGLPVLMWALHPIGQKDVPHYHFLLKLDFKDPETINKKVRKLLLEPKTRTLKSTPCTENWPQDPSSLNVIIAYMKRFTRYQDVWPEAVYWINKDSEPVLYDSPPGFLKTWEMTKYIKLKALKGCHKMPPLTQEIAHIKVNRKPTQRDLIQHVWDKFDQAVQFEELNIDDKAACIKWVYSAFSQKLQQEKLKYDKYQMIQMMNPVLCHFVKQCDDSFRNSILNHFMSQ